MKYDIKISLPLYKVLYGLAFMIIIVFVRGISSASEIVAALEPNLALLAGVFMSDNYYTEYRSGRIQVFYRYPLRKKYISVVGRCLVNWVYLLLLVIMAYGGFICIYRPMNFTSTSDVTLFINTILVSGISALFMGSMAFTITNFTQSIGAGISIMFFIWGCLSSKVATFLPKFLQLFLLEEPNSQPGALVPYYLSRVVYLFIAIALLISNIYSLQQQPKYKRKGRVLKIVNHNRRFKYGI